MFILVAMIIGVLGVCFLIGRSTAKGAGSYLNLRKYPVVAKGGILVYIVYSACFTFPISSELFPLDLEELYLLVASYGIIGVVLARLYRMTKVRMIYLISLVLTIVGMGCRYLLEYGEVSNTYNFTMSNVILYIVVVPIFIVIVYWCSIKYLSKTKKK